MISKSTKRKRRRDAGYYRMAGKIRAEQVMERDGSTSMLLWLDLPGQRYVYLEGNGRRQAGARHRWLLGYCRAIAGGQRAPSSV